MISSEVSTEIFYPREAYKSSDRGCKKLYRHTAGLDDKESTCNVGDLGSILGLGRSPGEGIGHPLQYSCLENPHGQRSLANSSPWGRKESEMSE